MCENVLKTVKEEKVKRLNKVRISHIEMCKENDKNVNVEIQLTNR